MIRTLIIMLTLAYCQYSHSCLTQAEFRFEDIVLADSVFVGDLLKYEVVQPNKKSDLSAYAIMTFSVRDYLGGVLRGKELEVFWHNSTFGLPLKLRKVRYLVAVTTNKQPALRGPSATIFPSQRPDLLSVLQAPCAAPFLLVPNKQKLERAKKLLKKRTTHNNTL